MKKLSLLLMGSLMLSAFFFGSAAAQEQKSKMKKSAMAKDMKAPYKALYSSDFEMGDPAKSMLVLEMWKDYDDNAFDRHADMFADSVVVFLSDGEVLRGKESMLTGVKTYRSTIDSVRSDVHAWMSLKSKDRNEDVVAVWGTENDTWKDGKKTANHLHEVWFFNKDGKVSAIRQFSMKATPAQME